LDRVEAAFQHETQHPPIAAHLALSDVVMGV
jgi:hypothetical protein